MPIKLLIETAYKILRNLKKVSLETLYLAEGFCVFFCITLYAGYTFTYTNFSIFLVIIMTLLKHGIKELNKEKDKDFCKFFEKIYKKSAESFYETVENNLKNDNKMFIVTANPETIMMAEKNEKLKEAVLDENTIIVPDGIGVVKGAEILNYEVQEKITGVELSKRLLQYAQKHKNSIYLFGAKKEVIEKLEEVIKKKYPNIQILGTKDGYVEDKDNVFKEMKTLKPDIILVALGIPNQEVLIYKHLKDFDKGIFVGVGGTFDVLSGEKKRAPEVFIKLHLEWLYRIVTEPKRMKRFIKSNVKYVFKINSEKNKL